MSLYDVFHEKIFAVLKFKYILYVCLTKVGIILKIKKTLCTCKRTLHNQMNGMAIGASLVLHYQVVGTRVVFICVVYVQRRQVAILSCVREHLISTKAI